MNFAIDLRPLQLNSKTSGIGVYTKNLVQAISRIDPDNLYFFLTVKGRELPQLDLAQDFHYREVPLRVIRPEHLNLLHDRLAIHKIFEENDFDAVHFPSPFELKLHFELKENNYKSILTVHDLTPVFFANKIFVNRRAILRPVYNGVLRDARKAGHIIAISEHTKKDVVNTMRIPKEKISVVYQGKDDAFRVFEKEESESLREVRVKYRLPDKFLLYVGGFSYHKNLFALLDAMVMLGLDYQLKPNLVIGGKIDKFFYGELKGKIDELNLTEQVTFTGFVPDEDLPALYNLAEVFVFPSLYEGFGLPVIEAMACGTPVVCSDVSSLPEIGGDAAHYFDPSNIADIAEVIHDPYVNSELREEMSRKGIEKADEFTWDYTAKETIEVYKKVAASKKPS